MNILKSSKTLLTVFTYLAFIIFPIIFANNIYRSFTYETIGKQYFGNSKETEGIVREIENDHGWSTNSIKFILNLVKTEIDQRYLTKIIF
jgi:hypothetical protein